MKALAWWDRWQVARSLRAKLDRDPFYRFASAQEVAIAAAWGVEIDANRATVDDWLRLPGLSITQARTLAELSRAGVVFYSLEDVAAALGWPVERLAVFDPVLRFRDYSGSWMARPLDVNQATVAELARLPGLAETEAAALVAERDRRGAYRSLGELQRRLAIAPDRLADLMHYLRVG